MTRMLPERTRALLAHGRSVQPVDRALRGEPGAHYRFPRRLLHKAGVVRAG